MCHIYLHRKCIINIWPLHLYKRGEVHYVVSHKSVCLFPLCQGHQKPVNYTRDMSGIPHSCLGCISQIYSLWIVKLLLSKAKFWLKKIDSQLARLQDLIFGNEETRQLELWNLAQWEILLIVPGNVLWRKCIGGLGAKINRAFMWNHCRSPSPWLCIKILISLLFYNSKVLMRASGRNYCLMKFQIQKLYIIPQTNNLHFNITKIYILFASFHTDSIKVQ